jgi:hypothetical protein
MTSVEQQQKVQIEKKKQALLASRARRAEQRQQEAQE